MYTIIKVLSAFVWAVGLEVCSRPMAPSSRVLFGAANLF